MLELAGVAIRLGQESQKECAFPACEQDRLSFHAVDG